MIAEQNSPQFLSLENEINSYGKEMEEWWDSLKSSDIGEWTFLLSLACWGVTNIHFQLAAFLIALLFFSARFLLISSGSKYTTRQETRLFNQIRIARVSDPEFYELIKKLKDIKKMRGFFRSHKVIKKTWKFLIAYFFLFASFLFVVDGYLLNMKNCKRGYPSLGVECLIPEGK
ncbi:MAG: hypothetical protein PV362_02745 [Providencia heimbachae]|nr:hypothetical protein [Providencia heimbachae]